MTTVGAKRRVWGLKEQGIDHVGQAHWNLPVPALYEQAMVRREGLIAQGGPLAVRTGAHTGRSPSDRFIVDEPTSRNQIWWGPVNQPLDAAAFERIYRRQLDYLREKELFVRDCYAGAADEFRTPLRIITESAWQSLFSRNMLIRPRNADQLLAHQPEFTVVCTPQFHAVPRTDETNSEVFILIHFGRKLVLIGGTSYAGEIKKSVFTLMHYLLPQQQALSMHCSANYGRDRDDVALFFGLSGTGKTTLSTSPDRTLIGDDEHGWHEQGVFNFEGGCYAKAIGLRPDAEPEIYQATCKFGTVLENVVVDPRTRQVDFDDAGLTENTRASYPLCHIANADLEGRAGHPKNIFFLTYDAFGVLPPIAQLTAEQARYYFITGYTSKVAGTERGVREPQVVFSTCFGAPFLPLPPSIYAELLYDRIRQHRVRCWLVNTGMTGGPYGVGRRLPLPATRALLAAALDGSLANVPTRSDPTFNLAVPQSCPGVDSQLLDPRGTWADPAEYDRKAQELAARFAENYRQY